MHNNSYGLAQSFTVGTIFVDIPVKNSDVSETRNKRGEKHHHEQLRVWGCPSVGGGEQVFNRV